MLKNLSRFASDSATITADGVSIIAPISRCSSKGTFSRRNSSLYSSTKALAWFNSSRPEIIGYIIFTLPSALARRIARSCSRKMSRSCRQNRIARHPRNGFISVGIWRCAKNLSPPKSSVRMTTGSGLSAVAACRYAWYCCSSPGGCSRFKNRYSVRNSPTPSAPLFFTSAVSAACSMFAERNT